LLTLKLSLQAAMAAHLHTLLAPATLSTAATLAASLPAIAAASGSQGPPADNIIQVQHRHLMCKITIQQETPCGSELSPSKHAGTW
jgi:hypothetical protein